MLCLLLLVRSSCSTLSLCSACYCWSALVVARFHYALPAIACQIIVNDFNRIDAVFAKASRWQLTSIVPNAADIVDNADKKTIPLCPQSHPLLTSYASIQKNAHGRCLRFKGHGRVLPMAKTERYKNSILNRCLYRNA